SPIPSGRGYWILPTAPKVEWVELFADLEHQGLYQAGDMIGLGRVDL
ncbi:LOW QUALITY PROTEIN: conserved hypothetical protein, partial [Vibrio cholerae RC385]